MIRSIIFDLDGTLIDTEPTAARSVEAAFSAWGISLTPKDSQFVTGRTWKTAFEYLFSKYKIPLPKEEAAQQIIAAYRQSLEIELPIVPGSIEAVRALAADYRLALVSGSLRSEVLWALDRLGIRQHFHSIFGAEDYPLSKPAPDGFLAAMQAVQIPPGETLIFEDSNAGIQSARAAGAWVVAITGTNHFEQDISKAHLQIPDLTPITTAWVKNFLAKATRES